MVSLIPWTERKELDRFRSEMDRLFDRFFDIPPLRRFVRESEWFPAMDVSETSKEVIVNAEIPGMDPKEIDISLNGRVLTVKGERNREHEEKDKNFHRVERRYGAFARSVELPAEVEAGKIDATYKDGVLKINLPKTKEQHTKKIEIKTS